MSALFFHWINPESHGVESSLSPGLSNSQHLWSASPLHCDRGPSHQHTSSGDYRPSRPAFSVFSGRQTGPVKTCCSESSRASHFTQQKSKSLKSPKAPHGLRPPPASAPFLLPGSLRLLFPDECMAPLVTSRRSLLTCHRGKAFPRPRVKLQWSPLAPHVLPPHFMRLLAPPHCPTSKESSSLHQHCLRVPSCIPIAWNSGYSVAPSC